MSDRPALSIVIPVLDGGDPFRRCLGALERSAFTDFELVVVDDGSSDGSTREAERLNLPRRVEVLATSGREGPAAARNRGAAAARASWLVFLDADCEVHPDTLQRISEAISADPGLGALFGSYDDEPAAPGVVAQYKNLLHHWVHQQAAGEAVTFWAGCGAVRRRIFHGVGGFDDSRYPRPSIEDIELGYRIVAAGHRIRLDPTVQVKHHKAWTLRSLVVTDVRDRALPWTALSLERGSIVNRLNLDTRNRWSAAAAVTLVAAAASAIAWPPALAGAALAGAALTGLNRRLYRFFAGKRGPGFLAAAIPLHWLGYLYSAGAFAWGVARHRLRGGSAARTSEETGGGRP